MNMARNTRRTPRRMQATAEWLAIGLLPLVALLNGCSTQEPANPSFPLSVKQAKHDLKLMQQEPVALKRPVIVLGGWGDVIGYPPSHLAKQLRLVTGDDRIIAVGFGGRVTFEGCRDRVLKHVNEAFPSDSDDWTREVDVIGFSMGGIVARYSAASQEAMHPDAEGEDVDTQRLRIANLYTICTPHRGALVASIIAPGPLAWDMRPGSEFMQKLDEELNAADYPVFPYTRRYDAIVGDAYASPFDRNPWWVESEPFTRSHMDAYRDPRIVADIAQRLRGESPYTTEPAAPLPGEIDASEEALTTVNNQ